MRLAALESVLHDLRYTLRGLRATPGFAAAVVITLALGIGANAAMFGIVDRMLLRPPPMMRDASATHLIYFATTNRGNELGVSVRRFARFKDLQQNTTSFSTMSGFTQRDMAVGTGDAAREMSVAAVSANFFDLFDAPPIVGRYFNAAEDSIPVGAPVVVLSHAYWTMQYGTRRDILGEKIQIGPTLFTVVGVAPEGFVGIWPDRPPAAFIPLASYGASEAKNRPWLRGVSWWRTYDFAWMSVVARRKPGVTVQQADADLTRAARLSYQNQLVEQPDATPITVAKPRAFAGSIIEERGPRESRIARVASWIAGVSLIVLLIACANVANLLLARALRRRREIAVRLALGASRRRLLSQLLTETLLLALVGGIVGLIVATWATSVMRAALLTNAPDTPVLGDARTLAFTAAVAISVGILAGLAPMLQAARASRTVVDDLRAGSREGRYRSRLRVTLLVLQAALSVVLLVGAGLFVRSVQKVRDARLGYDVDPVLTVSLNMRGVTLDSLHAEQLRDRLRAAAAAIPGVTRAARSLTVPFWSSWSTPIFVAGIDTTSRLGQFYLNAVSSDYLASIGTRVVRGRGIGAQDTHDAPRVAVISEGMAKTLWPGRDPLGQCMRLGADTMPCTTIVGIAQDIRQSAIGGDSALYSYYLPYAQSNTSGGLTLRVAGDAGHYAELVRRTLQREMPGASYVTVTTLREAVGSTTRSWEMGATMFVVFGALALTIAAIGLYSVIAYNVAQRTREVGIRIALGARSRDVVALIVRDGLRVAMVGVIIGGAIALAAARWIQPLLFEESPHDPIVFGIVTLALLLVATVACWVPARRAARVDPQVALRVD